MSVNQIVINSLSKVYDNGFNALKKVSLEVKQGEILACLLYTSPSPRDGW